VCLPPESMGRDTLVLFYFPWKGILNIGTSSGPRTETGMPAPSRNALKPGHRPTRGATQTRHRETVRHFSTLQAQPNQRRAKRNPPAAPTTHSTLFDTPTPHRLNAPRNELAPLRKSSNANNLNQLNRVRNELPPLPQTARNAPAPAAPAKSTSTAAAPALRPDSMPPEINQLRNEMSSIRTKRVQWPRTSTRRAASKLG
jgi:hypothetical protein